MSIIEHNKNAGISQVSHFGHLAAILTDIRQFEWPPSSLGDITSSTMVLNIFPPSGQLLKARMRPRAPSYQIWLNIITKYDRYTTLLRSLKGQKGPRGSFWGASWAKVSKALIWQSEILRLDTDLTILFVIGNDLPKFCHGYKSCKRKVTEPARFDVCAFCLIVGTPTGIIGQHGDILQAGGITQGSNLSNSFFMFLIQLFDRVKFKWWQDNGYQMIDRRLSVYQFVKAATNYAIQQLKFAERSMRKKWKTNPYRWSRFKNSSVFFAILSFDELNSWWFLGYICQM